MVSDQAVAVGVSAIPTPVTELSSDLWFVHQWIMNSVGAGDVNNIKGHQMSVDSRAMRKVEDGQDVVIVQETDLTGTGAGVILTVAGRMLGPQSQSRSIQALLQHSTRARRLHQPNRKPLW